MTLIFANDYMEDREREVLNKAKDNWLRIEFFSKTPAGWDVASFQLILFYFLISPITFCWINCANYLEATV